MRAPSAWFGCYQDSWKGVITDAAFAHPAKFSKRLIERILDYMQEQGWIKKGDTIGDPFGGVGTGGVIAAYRGYQWIGEELEEKFFFLAVGNFRKHRSRWAGIEAPMPLMILGDSRTFDVAVAAILSSPPYISGGHHTDVMNAHNKNGRGQKMKCHAVVASPPYSRSLDDGGPEKQHPDGYERSNNWTGYGKAPGQIATLKSGDVEKLLGIELQPFQRKMIDAVVASPPFLGARSDTTGSGGGINKAGYVGKESARPSHKDIGKRTYQAGKSSERDPENIEMLDSGNVSAVISSPPYETIHAGAGGLNHLPARGPGEQTGRKKGASQEGMEHSQAKYGDSPGQIARCEKASVDAVVSSPPWEKNVEGGRAAGKFKGDAVLKSKRGKGASDKAVRAQAERDQEKTLGDSPGQIGRESGETYWQAMAKVYVACLRSLKPGGYMAIVVKDFVKDQKRMRLCDDTMRLLVWLGFEEVERIHAMLSEEQRHSDLFEGERVSKKERKSFFRRLHESKLAADDPRRIDFEEVLFVRKPL